MAAEQRKLLEQLMGDTLNAPGASSQRVAITDPKVCRSYVAGDCPHGMALHLFSNTKSDLGPCPRVHSEQHKTDYAAATPEQRAEWAFTWDMYQEYRRFVQDCDHKIDSAQRRLEKTPEEIRQTTRLVHEISELEDTIACWAIELRELIEQKAVSLAVTEHYKMRATMQRKAEAERELKALSDTGGPSGHQKLQVCDTCGAYLSRLDNDRRLADHFFGKMHLGYAQMRKVYDELRKDWDGKPAPRRESDRDGHNPGGHGYNGPRGGYGGGGRGRGRGGRRGGGDGGGHRGRW